MPRYYSVCEATPSVHTYTRSRKYMRVYASAPMGYIFHDTEESLDVNTLRKPMFVLSELYENVKIGIYVRVNAHTIMATFNTGGIPRPARVQGGEYLDKNKLVGWLQKDVRDPTSDLTRVNYDDVYDTCTMLERFTGHCPCVKLLEGTCLPTTLYVQYPWLADNATSFVDPEVGTYKRKRYHVLNDFTYTPGQYSIQEDFAESVRPWDNYDFSLVEKRANAFSERGSENARRFAHRKIECSQCAFSTKQRSGTYEDCGQIRTCTEHTTDEQAWSALYSWLERTPYEAGTSDFALHEIHYLMQIAGEDHLSRAVTPTRNTKTKLGGFRLIGEHLSFRVAPCQGTPTRKKRFDSYTELRTAFPMLLESDKIPETFLDRKHVLAHAIFSTWNVVQPRNGHQPHPVYSITKLRDETTLTGTSTRNTFCAYHLTPTSHVMEYVQYLWPNGFARIKQYI